MGKLQSKQGGYYLLDVKIGAITVQKVFTETDKPLEEVAKLPDTDDFYLNIPDPSKAIEG